MDGVVTNVVFDGFALLIGGIYHYVEAIIVNKQAALQLASHCEMVQQDINRIFRPGKTHSSALSKALQKPLAEFSQKLGAIEKSMGEWAALSMSGRILKKKAMAREIARYHEDVVHLWRMFELSLSKANLAATLRGHAESRELLRRISREMSDAKAADDAAYNRLLRTMTHTLNTVDRLHAHGHQVNFSHNTRVAIQDVPSFVANLRSLNGPEDKPTDIETRTALIKSLRRHPEHLPLLSIDSSEFIVAIEGRQGEFSMVYRGIRGREVVAVKKLRFNPTEGDDVHTVMQRVKRESQTWASLRHTNIVPFYGYCGPSNEVPCMISPWMKNGNVRAYLAAHAFEISSHRILGFCLDIARGLKYIHSRNPPVVHGSLKASNVLISNDEQTAMITDFSLSCTVSQPYSGSRAFPVRWSAPEILRGDERLIGQTPVDIYGYANVLLEIMTGEHPFASMKKSWELCRFIQNGGIPQFPSTSLPFHRGLTAPLWDLMIECWNVEPRHRPSAAQIVRRVERMIA